MDRTSSWTGKRTDPIFPRSDAVVKGRVENAVCGRKGLFMKVGDLVKYKGSIGIVLGPCTKRWAKPADVWVLWPHKNKPIIESGDFMELVNESR